MTKISISKISLVLGICTAFAGCKIPKFMASAKKNTLPATYSDSKDSSNTAQLSWHQFYQDPYLVALIDTALKNNQDLNMVLQDVEIARNDIRVRKADLLPYVSAGASAGVEKVGRYTSQGAGDASADITPGVGVPTALQDYTVGVNASWELDIWSKLHNAKKAAIARYLSTVEGKNFVVSNLVAEVANTYYELLAIDNQLEIVRQSIQLQQNALELMKIQKQAAQVTELAVKKFGAEVLNSQSLEYDLLQNQKEKENTINFLLGRYPQEIPRPKSNLLSLTAMNIKAGIPSQLLANRPDVKQAELDLSASKLDVKIAKAEFYPSFDITAGFGLQAFKPSYLTKIPESLLYSLGGDLAGPLINRNAIKAEFLSANDRQVQAAYNYEKTILNAYLEVSNQLSNIQNLEKRFELKSKEVAALNTSIDISNDLFKSARADYLEVLMTQRDALDSKLELIEIKKNQLEATTNIYKELGGGWK